MPSGIYKRTKEHIKLLKKRFEGEGNIFYGKKHSERSKGKMSEAHKGKIPWNKDKKGVMPIPWNKGKNGVMPTPWNKGIKGSIKPNSGSYQKGEKNRNWNGGSSFEPYSVDWTETLKRAIRERDRYLCKLCFSYGNSVHHTDYNKRNNNPNNLITLCQVCHTKTNHNREYWKQYFQKL